MDQENKNGQNSTRVVCGKVVWLISCCSVLVVVGLVSLHCARVLDLRPSDIGIKYQNQTSNGTNSETNAPTFMPTSPPTRSPTRSPTRLPTNAPSVSGTSGVSFTTTLMAADMETPNKSDDTNDDNGNGSLTAARTSSPIPVPITTTGIRMRFQTSWIPSVNHYTTTMSAAAAPSTTVPTTVPTSVPTPVPTAASTAAPTTAAWTTTTAATSSAPDSTMTRKLTLDEEGEYNKNKPLPTLALPFHDTENDKPDKHDTLQRAHSARLPPKSKSKSKSKSTVPKLSKIEELQRNIERFKNKNLASPSHVEAFSRSKTVKSSQFERRNEYYASDIDDFDEAYGFDYHGGGSASARRPQDKHVTVPYQRQVSLSSNYYHFEDDAMVPPTVEQLHRTASQLDTASLSVSIDDSDTHVSPHSPVSSPKSPKGKRMPVPNPMPFK